MSRMNRRGIGVTLVWALVGVLMAFGIFYVAWNVYDAIYASTSGMQESSLCSVVLGMKQGAVTSDESGEYWRSGFKKLAGYVVPTRGVCGKTVVVKPDADRPSTPTATDVDVVLDRLTDEINRCWERSRLAQSVEFTCVHSFKFKLESGAISEPIVTKSLCYDSEEDEYTKWKNNARPGNNWGGGSYTCPGGDNLYGPEYLSDTKIHSFRIYYCGNNEDCEHAVRIEKEY